MVPELWKFATLTLKMQVNHISGHSSNDSYGLSFVSIWPTIPEFWAFENLILNKVQVKGHYPYLEIYHEPTIHMV